MVELKKYPLLSVCMIVKNEQEFLVDCLKSIEDVADELIIIDTGSIDNTVEIAKSFHAKVKFFDWIDDFAAARNESIKYATGNWILWLDADERLTKESISYLKDIIQSNHKYFYNIHITNKTKLGTTESDAHRLFRNVKGIEFEGRIHEQIYNSCIKSGLKQKNTKVHLFHLGYDQNEEDSKKKSDRNLNLLLKLVDDCPDSGYAHFTLAQCLSLRGEDNSAIIHFEKAFELKNMSKQLTASLYNCLSDSYFKRNEIEKAIKFADKSINLFTKQVGAYLLQYKIFNFQEKHKMAIQYLKQIINNLKYFKTHPKTISTDVTLPIWNVYKSISQSFLKLKDYKEAIKSLRKSWELNPEKPISLLKKFTELAVNNSDLNNACFGLEEMLKRKIDVVQVLDLLGITYIKQNKMSKAINSYENLLKIHPENSDIKRRVAALYLKIGNHDKAKQFLG